MRESNGKSLRVCYGVNEIEKSLEEGYSILSIVPFDTTGPVRDFAALMILDLEEEEGGDAA